MTDRLHQLTAQLAQTPGRLTRWKRICAEKKATTVEGQIACAQEALSKPHSGSWAEGMLDDFRLRELHLAEIFGGNIPEE